MIEVLVTLVPSICWLMYRCYRVLQTPVEELIENLHLEIPYSPNICIDAIERQSVILHWDIEAGVNEKLYYVILLNGIEAATVTASSCKLENLNIDTAYSIRVLAVNVLTSFRSESKTVYLRTLPEKDLSIHTLLGEDGNTLPPGDEEEVKRKVSISEGISSVSNEEIKKIDDADVLNEYLVYFQRELNRLRPEFKSYAENVENETDSLKQQLARYKQEYEEENDSKMRKAHNMKDMEKRKDKLSFQKSKLLSQIRAVENSFGIYESKLSDYDKKIRKLKERNNNLISNASNEKQKINKDAIKYEHNLENTRKETIAIESRIKGLTLEKRECITLINQVKSLIDELNSEPLFHKDGSLNKSSYEVLDKIIQMIPTWRAEIFAEISNYQTCESEWKETYRAEIRKYLSIQHSLEIAKSNKDRSYHPNKLTEYQASIEFGGYGNALPKTRYKKYSNSSSASPPNSNSDRKASEEAWTDNYSNIYASENQEDQGTAEKQTSMDSGLMQTYLKSNPAPLPGFPFDTPVYKTDNSFDSPLLEGPYVNVTPAQVQESTNQPILTNDHLYGIQSPMLTSTSLNHNVWSPNIPVSQGSDLLSQYVGMQNLNDDLSPPMFDTGLRHVNLDSPPLSNDQRVPSSVSLGQSSSQMSNVSSTFPMTNTLWNDSAMHTRNLSTNSNSQIWRNDNLSNYNFNIGVNFQPIMNLDNSNSTHSIEQPMHVNNSSPSVNMSHSASLYASSGTDAQQAPTIANGGIINSPPSHASPLYRRPRQNSSNAL